MTTQLNLSILDCIYTIEGSHLWIRVINISDHGESADSDFKVSSAEKLFWGIKSSLCHPQPTPLPHSLSPLVGSL